MCRKAYVQGMQLFGCGQCMPCRINRRRIWAHRLMLERAVSVGSLFLTLTYSEETMPVVKDSEGRLLGTLVPRHFVLWLKRFREVIAPQRIRFYACGEYGDETFRPHYHAAIFGVRGCIRGDSRLGRQPCTCVMCVVIRDSWKMGHVHLGVLEKYSCQYLARYVTKKMVRRDDSRLQGRYPEFARMSLRPGIGAGAMHEVSKPVLAYCGGEEDVPSGLRHGKVIMPLGRYLRRRLRLECGRSEGAVLDAKYKAEMLDLQLASREDAEGRSIAAVMLEREEGRYQRLVVREKLWKVRGKL